MRFNQSLLKNRTVVNYEGEKAYLINPEMELYTAVATTGLSDSFYESKDGRLDRIRQLVAMNDPAFTAPLAVYARPSMYLRSVPVVLAVELARQFPGNPLVKTSVQSVVQRADEITEMLAYYQVANGRIGAKKLNRLSKQIQKGLAEAFNHFDAYQFAKYNRPAAVTLRDALFLVHPKAKNAAQQVVFDQIAAQSLETPYTWETELSALGQQPFENEFTRRAAFAQKWAELIDSGKLGYMALLRNLRNILESGVEERYVVKLCEQLTNEKAVRNAKQLPFRYLSAYREMKSLNASGTRQVMQALEKAVSLTTRASAGKPAWSSPVMYQALCNSLCLKTVR